MWATSRAEGGSIKSSKDGISEKIEDNLMVDTSRHEYNSTSQCNLFSFNVGHDTGNTKLWGFYKSLDVDVDENCTKKLKSLNKFQLFRWLFMVAVC